jgi:hypothetical protein
MTKAKLDWQDVNSRNGYTRRALYRGLIIEAEQDSSPSNPFEDWDGEPPLAYYSDRDLTDYSDGEALDPFAGTSDAWFSRNWRALCAALEIDPAAHDEEVRQLQRDYPGNNLAALRRQTFESALEEMKPGGYYGGNASDYFIALEALWALRKVEALHWNRNGYSQSDWAEGIAVATPAWAERVGAPADSHKRQLKNAADLWAAWAYGDVYGYVVSAPDPDSDDPEEPETGETLDSCWGYYGDLEKSGIEAADSILAAAARNRAARLKDLIRNRVPLHLRPAMLAEAGDLTAAAR